MLQSNSMHKWIQIQKGYFLDRKFLVATGTAFLLLMISLVINYYAGHYADRNASNAVTDIILSNIRPFDVDGIFNYGAIVFWIFITLLFIVKPQRMPFTLKAVALFVLIRALFISLTHIAPFPTSIPVDPVSIVDKFTFGADLFFSGHTGLPFLMALVFWKTLWLRLLFIASSIMFGAVVLMGHLHYSIDVLSAFFITYTIFHIAEKLFRKDRVFFNDPVTADEQAAR